MRKVLLVFMCVLCGVIYAQDDNKDIFVKIKQDHNEKQFFKSVFENPALMPVFGKYKFSKIKATYSKLKDEAYLIQKPNQEENVQLSASSFFPTDSVTTLWGKVSYQNLKQRNVVLNESIDYDLLYPYLTADTVGGDLNNEKYYFSGGYAKTLGKVNLGAFLSYRATLASRSRDPRVRNVSSDLELKAGIAFNDFIGSYVGAYANYQKYSQSNSLRFFSIISNPVVYHLNGLGYFNSLLRGSRLDAFYEGSGYGAGFQFSPTKNQDIWFTLDYKQLEIGKFITEELSTQSSVLTNRNLDVHLLKLFKRENSSTLGVKLSYRSSEKVGVESILSARNGIGLQILAQNENYLLKNNTYELSGLYLKEKRNSLLSVTPYVNYQQYNEDYLLVRSFQYFDYLSFGVNSHYLNKINNKTIFSCSLNLKYKSVLEGSSLLRNDSEISLSNMVASNFNFLSSGFSQADINLKIDYKLKEDLNLFWSVNSNLLLFEENRLNYYYSISTGISF
ncbi:hypothetical protein EYW44_02960 [Tenacibaculum sp. M341]|nr:hypothetical protein EYW44_02960 [Tenacibaculum sp. M341]